MLFCLSELEIIIKVNVSVTDVRMQTKRLILIGFQK